MEGTEVSVDLFVRSLSPAGARGRPAAVLDRLDRLAEAGRIDDYAVRVWGREVGLSTTAPREDAGSVLDRVGEMRAWAARRGIALQGFETRETASEITGETYATLVLPVLALAAYRDGGLVRVAPHATDDGVHTVEDCLDALRRRGKEPERPAEL